MGEMPVRFFTRRDQHIAWHRDAAHLWAPVRTIGPWRHAVGSVMENVDNLAEPAGRLSQSTTLRGCYVPALVKRSMAWRHPSGRMGPLSCYTGRRIFSGLSIRDHSYVVGSRSMPPVTVLM